MQEILSKEEDKEKIEAEAKKKEKEMNRKKALIEKQIEHEKLISPQSVMGTAGKFLEGTETLLRYLMIPFFILGFAFWPVGILGQVFTGLALFCFCAAKISAFTFRDDFKDESDLLQGDPKFNKLLENYKSSLDKVLTKEAELAELKEIKEANKGSQQIPEQLQSEEPTHQFQEF